MSIGQEISVTALQMVAAFGAVANGGTLMQPRLVRSMFDAEGRETRRFEPKPVRQVISPETARTLTRLHGPGRRRRAPATRAAIPGYDVGGKTGHRAEARSRRRERYSHAPGRALVRRVRAGRRAAASSCW